MGLGPQLMKTLGSVVQFLFHSSAATMSSGLSTRKSVHTEKTTTQVASTRIFSTKISTLYEL